MLTLRRLVCNRRKIPVSVRRRMAFFEYERKILQLSVNSLLLNKHMAVLHVIIGNTVFLHNRKH